MTAGVLAAWLWAAAASPQAAAPPAAVRGVVVDAGTGAPIADARVLLVEADRSVRTGADGRFAFDAVPPGPYTLTVSRIGYIFVRRRGEAAAGAAADLVVPLAEGTGTYRETVTVAPESARAGALGVTSQHELGSAAIQDLRGVAADDPMRAVQALPGVATGDDFQAEFSIRGSAFRHVGVVVDGTPAPQLLHAVRGQDDSGSLAMVNSDILRRAALFAGPHPQRHGDWLGATLEFDLREGSRDRTQVRAAVSGTNASAVAEGPLVPGGRASWLFSVRRSYIGWLVRRIEPDIDSTVGFVDAQAKVSVDLTPRQQVELTAVAGRMRYDDLDPGLANGLMDAVSTSGLASLGWRYTRGTALVSQRVSVLESRFENRGVLGQELGRGRAGGVAWRADAAWAPAAAWLVEGGVRFGRETADRTLRDFASIGAGRIRLRAELVTSERTTTAGAWAQVTRRTGAGGVAAGARVAADGAGGWRVASPWLVGERRFGPVRLRGGAAVSHQFPGLDFRAGVLDPLRPERAVSIDAGVDTALTPGIGVQVTAFTRQDRDVLRRVGEDRVVDGRRVPALPFPVWASTLGGRTRGVDVVVARRGAAGLTGWAAYTWAHTRHTDRVSGETFDADTDQRHTINLFVQARLSYRTTVGAKFRAGSNFPIAGYFQGTPDALFLADARNGVRLPAYARLDVRATRTFTFDRGRLTLFVEVVNLLGRRNLGQTDGSIRTSLEARDFLQRLLPRVPSAGVLIEF